MNIFNIVNLTQHTPTKEQKEAGVICLPSECKIEQYLNYKVGETLKVMSNTRALVRLVKKHYPHARYAMIGGAPFSMYVMDDILRFNGITAVYAMSERVSTEKVVDGKVVKTSEFRHQVFVDKYGKLIPT